MHYLSFFWSGRFWTVAGGIIALASLLFSSYQFYTAAELNSRIYKGQLALEAHEEVYDFVAQFTQFYSANRDQIGRKIDSGQPLPDVHPNIRLALIRADGAIARAQVIDQPDIQACLQTMYRVQATLIESTMRQNKDVNLEEYAMDLDDFPKMIARYMEGKPLEPFQIGKREGDHPPNCAIIHDIGDYEF